MRKTLRVLLAATILVFLGAANAQEFSADNIINRTVVLSQAVHFNDPDGADVLVPPGAYWIIPETGALELLSFENGDSFVVRAVADEHDEGLTEEVALSTSGTENQPDVHSISFMFIDGTELVADGTYSGVQPRGLLDDAKKKAEAARRLSRHRAMEAKRRAQIAAAQARQRAQQAAAEARRRAEQLATQVRNKAEQIMNISCEDKIAAVERASESVSSTLGNLARQFPGKERPAQQVLQDLVRLTKERNPGFFQEAYLLRNAVQKELSSGQIKSLVMDGACGTNPAQTVAEFERIVQKLQQSVSAQSSVQARAAKSGATGDPIIDTTVESVRRWRDGGFGTSVSLELLGGAGAVIGGNLAVGIGGGYAGGEACPMPNVSGFCARMYFYRQLGIVTDVEANVGAAVGLWATNPRNFNGLYTVVGGSADTSVGPGVGADLVFDGNLRRFIECALENGASQCLNQTALLGVTVGIGASASLSPAEVHVQMGGEWTWWWKNGWVYDIQGPTPLWQLAGKQLGIF